MRVRSAHGNSLDHLIGAQGQPDWDFMPDRPSGLKINDKLEPGTSTWCIEFVFGGKVLTGNHRIGDGAQRCRGVRLPLPRRTGEVS